MHARVTRLEASQDALDEMTRQFEQHTVPVLEGLDGYKGCALLGDRGSGLAMAVASGPTVERCEVVSSSLG